MKNVCLRGLGGLLLALIALAGQPGYRAQFVGGTLPGIPLKASTRLSLTSSEELILNSGATEFRIPYGKVNSVEYGQNVSRRYAAAVLISPVLLMSKSRKHFVTVGYEDAEGKQQALVFRVDKGDIRSVLASLEARTGRRIEYQDNEARKGSR
jgi:hypothetical protein